MKIYDVSVRTSEASFDNFSIEAEDLSTAQRNAMIEAVNRGYDIDDVIDVVEVEMLYTDEIETPDIDEYNKEEGITKEMIMKTKYYVCGMNGIITTHRKEECAIKAYERRVKNIRKRNNEPVIAVMKMENGQRYVREWEPQDFGDDVGIFTWREVDSLIVNH